MFASLYALCKGMHVMYVIHASLLESNVPFQELIAWLQKHFVEGLQPGH